jgi:hypothetical protein
MTSSRTAPQRYTTPVFTPRAGSDLFARIADKIAENPAQYLEPLMELS